MTAKCRVAARLAMTAKCRVAARLAMMAKCRSLPPATSFSVSANEKVDAQISYVRGSVVPETIVD
jgi:hypothetical protein